MIEKSSPDMRPAGEKAESRNIIIFKAAENLFGIDVERVKEVIEPVHITPVPLSSEIIRGTINVRGVIIPVLDMCRRLYGCEMSTNQSSRIFISEVKDGDEIVLIGGLVDAVVTVVSMAAAEMSDGPEFGSNLPSEYIQNVGKFDERFVMILDMDRVFDMDDLSRQAISRMPMEDVHAIKSREYDDRGHADVIGKTDETESAQKKSYVLFSVGDETYGIDIGRIREVVKVGDIERLPNALPFMKGVMNLHGTAVPLIDMRLRCGLPEIQYNADTSALITTVRDIPVGMIVDEISNILEIPEGDVQDTFHYSAQIDRDFISGIIEAMNKFIILVNAEKILADEEFDALQGNETGVGTS